MKGTIKRILFLVISTLLILSFSIPSFATASDGKDKVETVRVGYFDFQNYMIGADNKSEKSGYVYDLLGEVGAVNNWKYEFIYGNFDDLYEQFLLGEIDILPCLVYTEDRANSHLFSDVEIYSEVYYISTLNENVKEGMTIRDLNGKKISSVSDCNQNDVFEKWAKENGIKFEFVLTSSFDESWEQVRDGRADYILNIDSASQDSGFTSIFYIGEGSSRFAIAPGRQDICNKLNSAVKTINEINPFSINHLKEKYLTNTLSSYILSVSEKEWLDKHSIIKFAGVKNDLPFVYESNGKACGVYVDMVQSMFGKLGIKNTVEWKLYDNVEEMHSALKNGEVDLICPEYYSQSFAELNDIVISEKILSVDMGALYRGNNLDILNQKVALLDAPILVQYINDYYPKADIVKYKTQNECVKAVLDGDADATIGHIVYLQDNSSKYLKSFKITTISNGCPVCFATNHENGMLICIINRGLHLISDYELMTLEAKHTPEKKYTFYNYVRENLLLVVLVIVAFAAIIAYAFERNMRTKGLKNSLNEITKQKEQIEANERELVLAREAANAASRAKTTFLFNMSHDIRTPMNAILGYSDRMLRHIDNKDIVADSVGKIKSSGEYLLSLINDVLDMARIESDKAKIDLEIHDIRKKAYDLCSVFEVDMQKRDHTFVVDFDDMEDTVVWYDSLKMRQIMLNLISNSIKYTREGGIITHTMRQIPSNKKGYGRYEIVVSDTGIGMNEDFVKHIFEQFSRSDDSITKATQGTGLGMSIVAKLVNLMGGSIDIKSELGVGTTITLIFDLELATEEQIEAYRVQNELENVRVPIDGIKIFLVDDNELNREIAYDILTEEGCIVVDTAENGKIAVEKIAASKPGDFDVVLMDIQMPVMDGYEATREIRALEDNEMANIPIVAMTANAFEEDRQNALDAGMNDHIPKPIDINKLSNCISKFIYNK